MNAHLNQNERVMLAEWCEYVEQSFLGLTKIVKLLETKVDYLSDQLIILLEKTEVKNDGTHNV